jgi:AcrR family transcriptional regulator
LSPEPPPPTGLRERKKAKTRASIQHQALRLFRAQGYEATTVEQIADAAEVSPSTFFRYFPNKEAVVLTDEYDPLIIDAIRAQPPELSPVAAIRTGIQAVFYSLSQEEMDDMRERAELALSVTELRAATLDQFAQTIRQITDVVADRAGHRGDDFAVATLAGAVLGVMVSALLYWVDHRGTDLVRLIDDALGRLEAGLAL